MRDDLPTGTVTFLFTDVEGSTRLLHELGADEYAEALSEHRRIVRAACATEGAVEVDTQGDAFFFAFPSASGAAAAAQAMTEALAPGPIQLRIGLHTAAPLVTDEGYVGEDVHFAARVAASGHGGQVVVSQSTRALLDGPSLTDLGEHGLKDIEGAVPIFQLGDESFPPLKTISNTNLPRPASSFVGRTAELADVLSLVEDGSRLLTLTGPGGSGKTRLALEAAATLVPSYKAGTFWVGLASLSDASLVTATISQTIGSANGLAEHIGEREMLLLLDNLEHVIHVAPELAALLPACPNLTLLVTSRELLRVQGEVEYEVPPLASPEAISLFCARSRLEPSEEIAELCSRLDDLPLALELAAARTKSLSPRQILEHLAEGLDLLRGGRDADPRQQTLRATIEWSYGLLSDEEQRLFRALSIFRGGCTLEAAKEVADADLDTLQSLVEKSLLRFSNERYWLLETVREYARDRLDEAGEIDEYARRHARHYFVSLETRYEERLGPRRAEALSWCETEVDNLRAMLDRLTVDASAEAAGATLMLYRFWRSLGAYTEAGQRLQMLLALGDLTDAVRADSLAHLAEMRERLGDLDGAEAAAAVALRLSAPATNARVVALFIASAREVDRGNVNDGVRLARLAAHEAEGVEDAMTRVAALGDLGGTLVQVGRRDEARAVIVAAVEDARGSGLLTNAAWGAGQLGLIDLLERDYESARLALTRAVTDARSEGFYAFEADMLQGLAYAYLGLGRRSDARATFGELLELASGSGRAINPEVALAVCGVALAVEPVDLLNGARLRGAVSKLRQDAGGLKRTEWRTDEELECRFEEALIDALGRASYDDELAVGSAMSLEETIALARSLADS
jgi:predicted ATPase/class 3 adenylate cyclase